MLLKRIAPPLEFNETALVDSAVAREKVILPVVAKFTPAIVAALATVNALLKEEAAVWKVTPDPAVRVVMPVIVPPPETPFTVIAAPFAVMFNGPVLIMRSSSASVRPKPATNPPKETALPALLVMLTFAA